MNMLAQSWKWLKWPLALGVLAFLVYQNRTGIERLRDTPKHWGYLFAALVLVGGSALLTFFRWYLLVWAQEFPFRIRDAVRLGFVGMLFSYIAPSAVGGDIFKAIFLAREQKSRRTVAIATVGLDRILGLLALFMVGAIASLFYSDLLQTPETKTVTALLWAGTAGGVVGFVLMLTPMFTKSKLVQRLVHLPYVGHAVGDLLHGVTLYQNKRAVLAAAMGISLLGHMGIITGLYCCALALQPWAPSLGMHFYFMPIAELFSVLMPLPGGVGALEGAIEYFYKLLAAGAVSPQVAGQAGFIAALAFRLVSLAITAIGGAYYLTARKELSAAMEEASHLEEEGTSAESVPPSACVA